MKTSLIILSTVVFLTGCMQQADEPRIPVRAPAEIINTAPSEVWQTIDNQNVLRIELETGYVYVELNAQLAPHHTKNIKLLAQEKFYEGLNVYRFVEGFVAQGGDPTGSKMPVKAQKRINAELSHKTDKKLAITALDGSDGYAIRTGFLNGFAVGQNYGGTKTWMTHCTGTFAMARGNEINSGGTEFYITLSPQRYLDRNITVFGRVLEGMQHVQQLQRTPVEGKPYNPIKRVDILSDVATQDQSVFEYLQTNSAEFEELVAARTNRPEPWFKFTPNYVDVCAITVPTRRKS
ncbi:peptidylprolyl isomerase [Pseudoalteromonas luteoviolacea]|uniref:peptidylprolyl isomerase n=1 Tax=Pseudoalteromonas luteoviolacea TaxID=43657 RepID=UPI00061CFDCB|nr:cyclophilin [Pseudoalteromonas luteoviolacea]AOT15206.1 cyclophilin [Pseudoalteromonas luteoviolacea]AOT20120.1 cyclophilin [Pseudoalteromonas luteoviolacea]